jgi:hypothetical protein
MTPFYISVFGINFIGFKPDKEIINFETYSLLV